MEIQVTNQESLRTEPHQPWRAGLVRGGGGGGPGGMQHFFVVYYFFN